MSWISIVAVYYSLSLNCFTAEGLDYMSFSERVSLSPRITRECISVGIIDDMSLELNESMTVSLALIGMQLKVQISPSKADVFINDDDSMYKCILIPCPFK